MTRLLPLLLVLAACQAPDVADAPTPVPTTDGAAAIGEPVPAGDALTPTALVADAAAYDGQTVLVEGRVDKVCQMAGCWVTFVTDDGQPVRINVPRDATQNYVFTFPDDAAGQTVRVAGTFTVEEESVEILRHYAEDEGAAPDEVAAITEPRRTLAIEATGAELAPANA